MIGKCSSIDKHLLLLMFTLAWKSINTFVGQSSFAQNACRAWWAKPDEILVSKCFDVQTIQKLNY